jgi:hypothetical protein
VISPKVGYKVQITPRPTELSSKFAFVFNLHRFLRRGGTLLRVEELSRAPSAPARNASVSSARPVPKQDVRVRIHLPTRPVGVARVESIYADGPCKNMVAGAGFPVILVPDENTASQIRTRFLRWGCTH